MKFSFNIEQYDLLSLDIFDTLWIRSVAKPIDIFELVWKKAIESNQTIRDITPYEFLKLRVELERRARNKVCHKEIKLKEIYDEMPSNIIKDIDWLITAELETEKEFGYINPDILELIKAFTDVNKKVVLLSDMYLSKAEMIQLLESGGFNVSLVKDIIISCDRECNKQSGLLYQELVKLFPDINKNRILHIGDNKNSDYEQAIKFGIQAFHYDVIPDRLNSIYDFEKIRHDIPQPIILSLRKIAADNNAIFSKEEKLAFTIGASVLGPFLSLFTSHIVNRLKQLNIHAIYPLMREGYLLAELLNREINEQKLDIKVKPIYTSRKASYIPAIDKIDREEIENIIGVRNISIEELILVLGLEKESFQEMSEYFGVKLKVSHKIPFNNEMTLKEYVINQLLMPDKVMKIEQYIKKERKLYIDYLKQEIDDFTDAATVDIGYVGRIQQWTEKTLKLEGISHKFNHFIAIGLTGEQIYDGMHIEGYMGTYAANQDLISIIHRTPDILEKLTSVCIGSTIGYKRTQEGVTPIQSQGVGNDLYTNIVFQGVLTFQKYWFYFRNLKPELASNVLENRRDTLKILHRLIDMPTKEEVKLLMNFEADTNFGTNYKESIITEKNISLLKEKGIEYIDKCNVSYTYENSNIVWPKGLITLQDEYYYVRKAMKNSAGNEIIKNMQEVVELMQNQGIQETALYGAGENGRQFLFICKLYGINVSCFIDRKESLWGLRKEGVPVMGLWEAKEKGNRIFLVTSLFSIGEIRDYIKKIFNETEEKPIIFSV
jgi:predicted HAD superfamily hydrolase